MLAASSPLMMETASIAETSVNFYQTTRRNNPEDSHFHTRRRDNLNSHHLLFTFPLSQNSGFYEREGQTGGHSEV
jgi:hypothetical protein